MPVKPPCPHAGEPLMKLKYVRVGDAGPCDRTTSAHNRSIGGSIHPGTPKTGAAATARLIASSSPTASHRTGRVGSRRSRADRATANAGKTTPTYRGCQTDPRVV